MIRRLPASDTELFEELGSKVRAQIRKAQKFEFETHIGGAELVDDFYRVFARNMRDLGTPVYDKVFFANIFSNVDPSNVSGMQIPVK